MSEFCVLALTAIIFTAFVFPDDAGKWAGRVAKAFRREADR